MIPDTPVCDGGVLEQGKRFRELRNSVTLDIHQVTNKTYRLSSTKFTIQQPDRAGYLRL